MSTVHYSRVNCQINEAKVTFANSNKTKFSFTLSIDDEIKNLPLNETIENHYDRTNYIHCDRWLSFLNGEIKTLDLRYSSLTNTGSEIIVTNDDSEVDYYGYDVASFDLEEVKSFTSNVIQGIRNANNVKSIPASDYTMCMVGTNLVAHINGKKKTLIPNMNHFGDTYYGMYCKDSYEGRMNCNSMRENIDDLRNSNFTVSFKTGGRFRYHISRRGSNYFFEECNQGVTVFEDSESLQACLDKIANLYG